MGGGLCKNSQSVKNLKKNESFSIPFPSNIETFSKIKDRTISHTSVINTTTIVDVSNK